MIIHVLVLNGKHRIVAEEHNLKVYTTEPRKNNKANYNVISQIAVYYNVDFHKIKLISGSKSSKKVFSIDILA